MHFQAGNKAALVINCNYQKKTFKEFLWQLETLFRQLIPMIPSLHLITFCGGNLDTEKSRQPII